MMSSLNKSLNGFSLIEYLCVFSIVCVLYTIATVSFTSILPEKQAKLVMTELWDTIEYGRSIAIDLQEPIYLRSTSLDDTFDSYALIRQSGNKTSTLLEGHLSLKAGHMTFNHGRQLKISKNGQTMTAGRFDIHSTQGERLASLVISRTGRCRMES